MNYRHLLTISLCFNALVIGVCAQDSRAKVQSRVKVLSTKAKDYREFSPQNTFIVLKPLGKGGQVKRQSRRHTVNMVGKRFEPRYKIIEVGDRVSFMNLDDFNHNVFSLSRVATFDLGSYGSRQGREVVFDKPGVVKTYCNMHASMAFFLYVSPSPWHAVVDRLGRFQISNIPPGEYRMIVWHIMVSDERTIELSKGQVWREEIVLDASKFRFVPHKNKYGQSYPQADEEEDDEEY